MEEQRVNEEMPCQASRWRGAIPVRRRASLDHVQYPLRRPCLSFTGNESTSTRQGGSMHMNLAVAPNPLVVTRRGSTSDLHGNIANTNANLEQAESHPAMNVSTASVTSSANTAAAPSSSLCHHVYLANRPSRRLRTLLTHFESHPTCTPSWATIQHATDLIQSLWERDYHPHSCTPAQRQSNRQLATYIRTIVSRSRLSLGCLILALLYIQRLKRMYPSARGEHGCGHRLFLVSFMVASTFLARDPSTGDPTRRWSVWAQKSGVFSAHELERMELEFLNFLRYDLSVSVASFMMGMEAVMQVVQQVPVRWEHWNEETVKEALNAVGAVTTPTLLNSMSNDENQWEQLVTAVDGVPDVSLMC